MLLQTYLKALIRRGQLTVRVNPNLTWTFGTPDPEVADVTIWFDSRSTAFKVGLNPYLYFGEAFVEGDLLVESGNLWSLMELIGINLKTMPKRGPLAGLIGRLKGLVPHSLTKSRQNVAHHYDLSEELYRLFLDHDMQYSCAYFARPDMTLEEAQVAKKDHIAAKLDLKPGQKVLDIGCGWGGMALHLARRAGVDVTGVTLSTEQLSVAQMRAQARDIKDKVHFELCDYRKVEGTFDRVVSVGMFEHVGKAGFDGYFEAVAERLSDDGVALIHTIGRRGESGARSAWLDKYIFPGGYLPNLSEMSKAVENAGLYITDVEMLRLHYAETLRHWRERFEAHRGKIEALYDERFGRMWEFYLCYSELGFRYGDLMVFQVQVSKKIDTLPVTRDYMADKPDLARVVDFEEELGKRRKGRSHRLQAVSQSETR